MVNKLHGVFTKADEEAFETFAIYCGLALHHAKVHEHEPCANSFVESYLPSQWIFKPEAADDIICGNSSDWYSSNVPIS